ncbi:TetR family transcriptional regulator [Streptomyces sp. SID3343]|nr:TetR family transcriptional regulator [Streptomyces sp. SID3343]
MTRAAVREPRQGRSRATRVRLLDTAVQVLAELGWQGGTVTVVAGRVGLSRGAVQHHFPTREDLFTAAIDYMAGDRLARARLDQALIPEGPGRTEAVIEAIIATFRGPLYRAALQLWVAAADNVELRAKVLPLDERITHATYEMTVELLRADLSLPGAHEAVLATLELARGLGISDLLDADPARRRPVVRQWAASLDIVLGGGATR